MEIIYNNKTYKFIDVNYSTQLKTCLSKVEFFLSEIDNDLDIENLIIKNSELHKFYNQDITLSQLAKSKLKYRIGYNTYLLINECFDELLINYKYDFSFKKNTFGIKNVLLKNIFSFLLYNEIKEIAKCSKMLMMFYISENIKNRLTNSIKIVNIKTLKHLKRVEGLVIKSGIYTYPQEPFHFDIIPLNQTNFLYVTINNGNILNITKYYDNILDTLLNEGSLSKNRISIKKFTDVVICSDDTYNYLCYLNNNRKYINLSKINFKYDYIFEIDRDHIGLVFSFNFLEVFNITDLTTEYYIDLFSTKKIEINELFEFKVQYPVPKYPNPPIYYFKSNHLYLITKFLTVYDIVNNIHVKNFKNIHSMLNICEVDNNNILIESNKFFYILNTNNIKIIKTIDKNDLVKFYDFYFQLKLSEPCILSPFKKFNYDEIEKNILLKCPQISVVDSIRELDENSVNITSQKFNYVVDLNSFNALGYNPPSEDFIKSKPEESIYIRSLRNMSNLYSLYKQYDITNISNKIKYYNPYCQETVSYDKYLYVYNRSSYNIDIYEMPENMCNNNYFIFKNIDLFYDIFKDNIVYERYFYKEKQMVSFFNKDNNKLINSIWISNSSKIYFNKKGIFIIEKDNTLALFNDNFNLEKKISIEINCDKILFKDQHFIKYTGSKIIYWNIEKDIIKMKEIDEKILGVGVFKNHLEIVCSKTIFIFDENFNIIKSVKINNIIENPIFIDVDYLNQITILNERYLQIFNEVENEFQCTSYFEYNKNYEFNNIIPHKIKKVDIGLYILFSDELALLDVRNFI